MNIIFVSLIILFISILMSVKAVRSELTIPDAVKKIKIRKKKGLSGVILFLKKKVTHYSSGSS